MNPTVVNFRGKKHQQDVIDATLNRSPLAAEYFKRARFDHPGTFSYTVFMLEGGLACLLLGMEIAEAFIKNNIEDDIIFEREFDN